MKCILLLALTTIAPAISAQPEQPQTVVPKFKATRENFGGVALVGAFYNTMQRAKSYKGHLTLTKTKTIDGKIVLQKFVDWSSTWLGKGDGNFEKRKVEVLYAETVGDKKTTIQSVIVDDGRTLYRHSVDRKIWSQEPHVEDSDVSQAITFGLWMSQLLAFDLGAEFTTEKRIVPNQPTRLAVTAGKRCEFVLNEQTGLLDSWRISNAEGETTELRFLEIEVNKPISDTAFTWKAPEGTKQVEPEETQQEVQI